MKTLLEIIETKGEPDIITAILDDLEVDILNNEDEWSRSPQNAFKEFKATILDEKGKTKEESTYTRTHT